MDIAARSSSLVATRLDLASITSRLALAAAAVVLAMFGTFVLTGIGQDPLQYVHTPSVYTAFLLKDPPVLRMVVGMDNLFIVLYSAMFLSLAGWLWEHTGSRPVLLMSMGLLGLSGVLDLLENMHFLTMISMAAQGLPISESRIAAQVWESLVKFHVSYLGLFLLGMAIPRDTLVARWLCFALCWVQLPVGLLIYLTPQAVAFPLVLVRFTFFLLALLAISRIAMPRAAGSSAPA